MDKQAENIINELKKELEKMNWRLNRLESLLKKGCCTATSMEEIK